MASLLSSSKAAASPTDVASQVEDGELDPDASLLELAVLDDLDMVTDDDASAMMKVKRHRCGSLCSRDKVYISEMTVDDSSGGELRVDGLTD